MRKIFLILLFLPLITFCQHKKLPPKPPTFDEAQGLNKFYQCLHQDIFSVKQRRAFFPFKNIDKVELISFNDPKAEFNILPVNHHVLNRGKVREIKILNMNGIDSLTNILYNIGYTPVKGNALKVADPGGKCFNPRNAILFIDKNKNVAEYIELCFQCHKIVYSSKKIKETEYCEQKFEILKSYFLTQGIKIGTVSETSELTE